MYLCVKSLKLSVQLCENTHLFLEVQPVASKKYSVFKIIQPMVKFSSQLRNTWPGAPGWLIQVSIQLLVSAQIRISRFMSSSPVLGSELTMVPAWDSLSSPSSTLPSIVISLSPNKFINLKKKKKETHCHINCNVCVCTCDLQDMFLFLFYVSELSSSFETTGGSHIQIIIYFRD